MVRVGLAHWQALLPAMFAIFELIAQTAAVALSTGSQHHEYQEGGDKNTHPQYAEY